MIRNSAKGSNLLPIPHYRFELRALKHSNQHTLLLDLEAAGNEVYYCAPEFHLSPELNDAFSKAEVPDKSRFFAPSAIGALPDANDHSVAFRSGSPQAWLFSEPRELHNRTVDSIFGPNARRTGNALRTGSRDDVFRTIGDDLLNVFEQSVQRENLFDGEISRQIISLRQGRTIPDSSKYASFVSQTLFGCMLLLVDVPPVQQGNDNA
jgi:hypothetical protein